MNLFCKLGRHFMYYFDYPDLPSEYQRCSKCGREEINK